MRTLTALNMAMALAGLASTKVWNTANYQLMHEHPISVRNTGIAKSRRRAKKRRRAA